MKEGEPNPKPEPAAERRGPPGPPPRGRPPPKPTAALSDETKRSLTVQALGLLNEQVQARIVHYRGDLETSPELDAITAQVVQQLKDMQAALGTAHEQRDDPDEVERRQVLTLTNLLRRICAEGDQTNLISRNLKPIGKRVAKLFFESELHEKTKGDKGKVIQFAEQGVYYVLTRYKNRLRTELDGFDYANDDVRDATFGELAKIERDLQVSFLSRRSPELNRVMTIFATVLVDFFQKHLPPRLEQMAKLTIRNAESAVQPNSASYKIQSDRFQAFREAWERLLMQQMVNFCGDELMARLTQTDEAFRDETVKFFTDPHIFSETCEVLCDHLYDYLCLEGFLDLPVDWRVKISRDSE